MQAAFRRAGVTSALCSLVLGACWGSPHVVDLRPDTGTTDSEPSLPSGVIYAAASSMDFGAVAVGDRHDKLLTVSNTGGGDLHLLGLQLDDEEAPFDVGDPGQVVLSSGTSTQLEVAFEPIAHGWSNTTLLVESDDPTHPNLAIDLNGEGVAPVIQALPPVVSMGPILAGEEEMQRISLYNAGNDSLLVQEVLFEATSDELSMAVAEVANGPLPWSLASSATLELGELRYAPLDPDNDSAYLEISSTDPVSPVLRVDVSAEVAGFSAQQL